MLTPQQESQLFESIARNQPQFLTWLEQELSKQHKTLVSVVDGEQLRRAQGAAQQLQNLMTRLISAKTQSRQ